MGKRCSDNKATYFVFRLEGARRWLLVTYVPEGVSVKDKMVYASTKGTLKSKLGYSFFDEEVHFTTKNEVTWNNYLDSRKAVESRSTSELMREEVYKQEETERKERGTATTDATSLAVSVPMGDDVKDAVNKFKLGGTVNFICLGFNDKNNGIVIFSSKSITSSQLSQEVNSTEPRYYLFKLQSTKNVFIYCCPEKSPVNLRMVYSTSKSQVAEQIEKLGVALAKKRVEVSDPKELTNEYLNSESSSIRSVNPKASPVNFRTNPSESNVNVPPKSNTSNVTAPHPIYSLMSDPNNAGNKHVPTTGSGEKKKKIVIPPQHAW